MRKKGITTPSAIEKEIDRVSKERIEQVRKMIASREYKVSAKAIARQMIEFHRKPRKRPQL